MNKNLITQLVVLFLITQAIGIVVGDYLINEDVHATLINDDPNSIDNSIGLFVWILVFTGFLLVLLKYAPEKLVYILLKTIESLAVFGTGVIILSAFISNNLIILGIPILLIASRIIFRENILLRNISSISAAAGAGALIGVSLGIVPILVFIILLAIYDLVAVFKTKHMVTLAKGITKKNLSFTFAMPTKEHQYELGTGDIVIPLAFAVSVLGTMKIAIEHPLYYIPSILILFASLIGLIATIHFVSLKKGRALPALPLQTLLMVIVYLTIKFSGF